MCRAAKLLLLLLPALAALQPLPARTGSVTRSLVDSMYAYTQRESTRATIIFRFDRTEEAVKVMQQRGIRVLGPDEIADRR